MTTPPERTPPCILVVDDTIANLRLLTDLLDNRGFDVRPVTSGRMALAMAEHSPPDLVLLDISMPEMDGFEVCKALKAADSTRDVPVIFLTALTETNEKVRAFEFGAVDYITKPFQFEEVLARVETHLALRQARRDVVESLDKLHQAEQLREQLSHMVVHDMRNVLMVAAGYLSLIEMAVPDTGELADDVKHAQRAMSTATRMTQDLIDLSRLESGEMPIVRTDTDLVALAREVTMAVAAVDDRMLVRVAHGGVLSVSCDVELMRRVLHNLLTNAAKYTPEGSTVDIAFEHETGFLRVTIDDEGPGVPEELRQRIFDKFVIGTATARARSHSAGLGLAFCKLAVQAHGGDVGVESRAPHGSRFWFTLPSPTH